MLRTAQQVQQILVIVFACALQSGQAQGHFLLEISGVKALCEQLVAGQLVDHSGVLLQIAGRPFGCT